MPIFGAPFSKLLTIVGILIPTYFYFARNNFEPKIYTLPDPPILATNNKLQKAEYLLKGQILGPESLVVERVGNDEIIYTGTWDAKIHKIVNGKIEKTIRFTNQSVCGTYDTEPVCGRPLGIRRLNKNLLIVADAYLGIFTVDFENNSWKQIFSSPNTQIDGRNLAFLNDLDVLDENNVFFTDSSDRWDRRRFLHVFLESKPDGRVFKLNLKSGQVEVVLDNLRFPNGIQIHPDRKSFVVSECSMARIIRYYFDGPKKGQREIFAENLPGFPDNIRISSMNNNKFYVGLASIRHSKEPALVDKVGAYPLIRHIIYQLIPDRYLAWSFSFIKDHINRHGAILELNTQNGFIHNIPQDSNGSVITGVSQVSDDGGENLYFGSFNADFIAKISKKDL